MKFEKWTALGNDYLIVEAAALPWELNPERIKRICDRPFGVGADGILLLLPVEDPAHVAELRIFNRDGSEAELSGNGARQAAFYLRHRGWTDADEFTILTKAGPITDLTTIGPEIERHELFPNRTNVSFFHVRGALVRARIFERGVGETLSSGTGASGAAVAAVLAGAESPLTVQLDGGQLQVEVSTELEVRLTGWAEHVYTGEFSERFTRVLGEIG